MSTRFFLASLLCLTCLYAQGQTWIEGFVKDQLTEQPLAAATISAGSVRVLSDDKGLFRVRADIGATLQVSMVGYMRYATVVDSLGSYRIYLTKDQHHIEEVEIHTGYYSIPRERATGSFVHIGGDKLNRSIGTNILERIEGLASGVQFVNPNGTSASDIRIRGVSTIESDEAPLIILDNFPYSGNLDNIDPDDVESITILKDAASASIWGAKAGNGVIVITSKRAGTHKHTNLSVSYNQNVTQRPDLFYSRRWLASETVMEIEKARFELGQYLFDDRTVNPYYVDLLQAKRTGQITDARFSEEEERLRQVDVRKEALKYLYQKSGFRQFSASLSGGTDLMGYQLTSSAHQIRGGSVGMGSTRFTLGARNRFQIGKGIRIDSDISYVDRKASSDGIGFDALNQGSHGISPYAGLKDGTGRHLALAKNYAYFYESSAFDKGLLDWQFRPLDELGLDENRSAERELRLSGTLRADIWRGLRSTATYRYTQREISSSRHAGKDSYHVRNLVNRFTQSNGTRVIPHNDILYLNSPLKGQAHQLRAQLDYQLQFGQEHLINSLVGADISQNVSDRFPSAIMYDFDKEYMTGTALFNYTQLYDNLPLGSGRSRIPMHSIIRGRMTNRDLSYFANTSYSYSGRYIVSGSLRWDGSNLLGVKTNQKGVPLWSIGGSWDLSKEPFYPFAADLPYLRLRTTYGFAGNVNKTVSHFPTFSVGMGPSSIYPMATITSVGNPSLRWEKVSTLNLAVDWNIRNNRLSGSFEAYLKKATDLIGDDYMDPTTGVSGPYKINYADLKGRGLDITLTGRNLTGPMVWTTTLFSSLTANKITNYNTQSTTFLRTGESSPVIGHSRDVLFMLPWHGLNIDGLPIIFQDAIPSTAYRDYYEESRKDHTKLLVAGSRIPVHYGSLDNRFSWEGLDLSILVTWKTNYVFRRSSMAPFDEFSSRYHVDYFDRWERSGDENRTQVPRYMSPEEMIGNNLSIPSIYLYSEALITRGDHVRLKEIGVGYTFPGTFMRRVPVESIRFSCYARELGLLWSANRQGLDPDYYDSPYPSPVSVSLGVQCKF